MSIIKNEDKGFSSSGLRNQDGNFKNRAYEHTLERMVSEVLSHPHISNTSKVCSVIGILKSLDINSSNKILNRIKLSSPSTFKNIQNNYNLMDAWSTLSMIMNDLKTSETLKAMLLKMVVTAHSPFYAEKLLINLTGFTNIPKDSTLYKELNNYLQTYITKRLDYFEEIALNEKLSFSEKKACIINNFDQIDFDSLQDFYQSKASKISISPILKQHLDTYLLSRKSDHESTKQNSPGNTQAGKRKRDEKKSEEEIPETKKIPKSEGYKRFSSIEDDEEDEDENFIEGTSITNEDLSNFLKIYLSKKPETIKLFLTNKSLQQIFELAYTPIDPSMLNICDFPNVDIWQFEDQNVFTLIAKDGAIEAGKEILSMLPLDSAEALISETHFDIRNVTKLSADSIEFYSYPPFVALRKLQKFINSKQESKPDHFFDEGIILRYLNRQEISEPLEYITSIITMCSNMDMRNFSKQNILLAVFKSLSFPSAKEIYHRVLDKNPEFIGRVWKRYLENPFDYTNKFTTNKSASSSSSSSISGNGLILDVQEILSDDQIEISKKITILYHIIDGLPCSALKELLSSLPSLVVLSGEKEILVTLEKYIQQLLYESTTYFDHIKNYSINKTLTPFDLHQFYSLIQRNRLEDIQTFINQCTNAKLFDLVHTESDFFPGTIMVSLINTLNKPVALLILERLSYGSALTILNWSRMYSYFLDINPRIPLLLKDLTEFVYEKQDYLVNLSSLITAKNIAELEAAIQDLSLAQKIKIFTTKLDILGDKTLFQQILEQDNEVIATAIFSQFDPDAREDFFDKYQKINPQLISNLRSHFFMYKFIDGPDKDNSKRELEKNELFKPISKINDDSQPPGQKDKENESKKEREEEKPFEIKNTPELLVIHERSYDPNLIKIKIKAIIESKDISVAAKETTMIALFKMMDSNSSVDMILSYLGSLSQSIAENVRKYVTQSKGPSFFSFFSPDKSSSSSSSSNHDFFIEIQWILDDVSTLKSKGILLNFIFSLCPEMFFAKNIQRINLLQVVKEERELLQKIKNLMMRQIFKYLTSVINNNQTLDVQKSIIVDIFNDLSVGEATKILSELGKNSKFSRELEFDIQLYLIEKSEKSKESGAVRKDFKASSNGQKNGIHLNGGVVAHQTLASSSSFSK